MKYTVPVSFTIDAMNADHAAELVEKALETFPIVHQVYQGNAHDVKGVKVSDTLLAYIKEVCEGNDLDTDGWNTDLDWCWQTTDDDDVSDEIKTELEFLIKQVGGAVRVAAFL